MRKTIEDSLTNKELVSKLLEKAERNGWEYPFKFIPKSELVTDAGKIYHAVYKIIFSHDFLKAFFKGIYVGLEVSSVHHPDICKITEIIDERSVRTDWKNENPNGQLLYDLEYNTESWKKRAQEMVLDEEPLRYLGEFL